jgi:Golgi apparatus protein 1
VRAAITRKEEMPATPECLKEVRTFAISAIRAKPVNASVLWTVEPVQGIREACRKDAGTMCPGMVAFALTKCLKTQKKKLSTACSTKLFSFQMRQSKDLALSPAIMKSCEHDLEKFKCVETDAPVKIGCLKRHRKDLQEACRASVFQREVESSEDIRLNNDVYKSCKAEISQSCSNKEFGEARMLMCLWETSALKPGASTSFSPECKTEVDRLTIRSVQDYRLDWRLRASCTEDIDKSCALEKAMVDNMTMTELFGTSAIGDAPDQVQQAYDGQNGMVIKCLKKKHSQITKPACKQEVGKVVRVQAMHTNANPEFVRNCQEDKERFCANTPPAWVHQCLRKHIDELSEGCKKVELTQGKVEATSITLKPQLQMACATAITEFCSTIAPVNAQVIRCLQDKRDLPNFPAGCKTAVETDLEASNHDWRLKYGISHECQEDATRLCSGDLDEGAGKVLGCLKAQYEDKKIKSSGCLAEMRRFVKQGVSDIRMAPNTYKHCVFDVENFCEDVEPGGGKIHDCLLQHKQEISLPCARAEFRTVQNQVQDIRVNKMASAACKPALEKYCGTVEKGRAKMWDCLKENSEKDDFPPLCAKILEKMKALRHSEFFLNPFMSMHCKKDAETLCSYESQNAATKDFSSDGELISCLIDNLKKVKSVSCKADLRKKSMERLKNAKLDPARKEQCEGDIERFCEDTKGDVTKGATHTCLSKHLTELTIGCQQVTKKYMKVASSDIRTNAAITTSCKVAQKNFCSDVAEGGSRVINCLLNHAHDESMDPTCKSALVFEEKKRASSFDFNTAMVGKCKADLDTLTAAGKCDSTVENWQLACLTAHLDDIKQLTCKVLARGALARQSADLRAVPGMQKACESDLNRLCPGVEAGGARWNSCLREKRNLIQSPLCKGMVGALEKQASGRATVNYAIKKNCANEMKNFCKDVQPGNQQITVCLKMHSKEPGFGAPCNTSLTTAVLKDEIIAQLKNFTFNKKTPLKVEDIQKWIEDHQGVTDKYGGALLAGTISFVMLMAFVIAYCCLKRQYSKVMFAAVNPDCAEVRSEP